MPAFCFSSGTPTSYFTVPLPWHVNNYQCLFLSYLPISFNLTHTRAHAHTLVFIHQCDSSVSPSWAISHSSLPLNSVNLNPVLHQYISLWSWAAGESRDYQRPTSAVVPISAFCQTLFIKIKGSSLPFASVSLSLPPSLSWNPLPLWC